MSSANQSPVIAIDAMGGDFGIDTTVPGVFLASEEDPSLSFRLYGPKEDIEKRLNEYKGLSERCEIVHTYKGIKSEDKPSMAVRNSQGTSMRMALEDVQSGTANAVVSSGNTGALMALAKLVLKTMPGIHRPAIASIFPTLKGSTVVLDLGANVLVDAENLVQFAVLGTIFAKIQKGLDKPEVGLLNVGSEEMKGPDHVREAASMLSEIDFPGHYYGFVEGNDITSGIVDVVVTDGYAGNIALKAAEGVGKLTKTFLKEVLSESIFAKLGALLAYGALQKLKKRVDPRLYNGGVFLGLNGLCIKSHGGSDPLAFSSAVRLAAKLAGQDYVKKAGSDIQNLMAQEHLFSHSAI